MEGLIIFIIISLIGYFFSDKKGEKKPKKNPKQRTENKPRTGRLDELMQQMKDKVNEIEEDTKPLSKRQEQARKVAQQAKKRAEQLAQDPRYKERVEALEQKVTAHDLMDSKEVEKVRIKPMDQIIKEQSTASKKQKNPLFHTKNDVKRAVLMAEILGPPKAKRK